MKLFEQRWRVLAGKARDEASRVGGDADAAPEGFARRVVWASRRAAPAGDGADALWLWWGRGALALVVAVALVLGGLELVSGRRPPVLAGPAIADSVGQLMWKL